MNSAESPITSELRRRRAERETETKTSPAADLRQTFGGSVELPTRRRAAQRQSNRCSGANLSKQRIKLL